MLELQQMDFKESGADVKLEVGSQTRENGTGSQVKNANAAFSVFGEEIKRRIEGRTRHYFFKKCGTLHLHQ